CLIPMEPVNTPKVGGGQHPTVQAGTVYWWRSSSLLRLPGEAAALRESGQAIHFKPRLRPDRHGGAALGFSLRLSSQTSSFRRIDPVLSGGVGLLSCSTPRISGVCDAYSACVACRYS